VKITSVRPKGRGNVDPDLTPMIDCVFNLLIFFLLTLVVRTETNIDVPISENFEKPEAGIDLIVEIDPAGFSLDGQIEKPGAIRLEGDPVSIDQLVPKIQEMRAKKRNTEKMILKADRYTYYKAVKMVLNAARDAGITSFLVATREP
jgi:biopolymer transport protein ExbD